jgi:hypothetical protein
LPLIQWTIVGLVVSETMGAVTTAKWNHREEELILRLARGDNDLTVTGRPLFEQLG